MFLKRLPIAGCSYQVQSVQAGGMYVNPRSNFQFMLRRIYRCSRADTDFIALGHNNSSWNVVSLWFIVLFFDALNSGVDGVLDAFGFRQYAS